MADNHVTVTIEIPESTAGFMSELMTRAREQGCEKFLRGYFYGRARTRLFQIRPEPWYGPDANLLRLRLTEEALDFLEALRAGHGAQYAAWRRQRVARWPSRARAPEMEGEA